MARVISSTSHFPPALEAAHLDRPGGPEGSAADGTWDETETSAPCLLCSRRTGRQAWPHHLTHGIRIWLCDHHRSDGFLRRRRGKDFVEGLSRIWRSAGMLNTRQRAALRCHLQRIATAEVERNRPGSYSWPRLRAEAERRFAAGEAPNEVIRDLRTRHRTDAAVVPTVRTMRRWFTDGRWLIATSSTRRARATRDIARTRRPYVDPYGPPYPERFTWERHVRDYGIPLRHLGRSRRRTPP